MITTHTNDQTERLYLEIILKTPQSLVDHIQKRIGIEIVNENIQRFVFRNKDRLELIENLLTQTRQKMTKSNCAYLPPSPVSYLITIFPVLKESINSYLNAKQIAQTKTDKFLSELKKFGLLDESIKTLEKEGIEEFYQLKRLLVPSQKYKYKSSLDKLLLRSVGFKIGQILKLEDYVASIAFRIKNCGQYQTCIRDQNQLQNIKKYY